VGDAGGGAGGGQHRGEREVLREGVAGLVADDDAQADALINGGGGAADEAVLHGDAARAGVLEVEIGRVGAAGGELGEHAVDGRFVDREPRHCCGWIRGHGRVRSAAGAAGEEGRRCG
jgi:hypothetical protein